MSFDLRQATSFRRKIVVGDRDWRLVWWVTQDVAGAVIVDMAEIWAFGGSRRSRIYTMSEWGSTDLVRRFG